MEEKIKETGQKLTKKKGLKPKQKRFIEEFIKNLGNISDACNGVKIKRQTFYNWKKDDFFAVKFQEALDEHDDGVQQRILKLAMEQDKDMLKFWAANKMKHRGFGEKREIDIKTEFVGLSESAALAKEVFEKYYGSSTNVGARVEGAEC